MEAAAHREGPLLILAGAGTGKTRVITERLARLMAEGMEPENLLGVTFTNKAAAEMRARLAARMGKTSGLKRLVLSTFHSLAVRILRRDAARLGYTPGFSICDRGEQLALVRKAAATVRGAAGLAPETLLARVGGLKNRGVAPESFARSALEEEELTLAAVYRRYQDGLRRRDSLDFDDLVLQAGNVLRGHPDVLALWSGRFHYLMIDEFQDANQSQFEMMRLLAAPRDNLCVVGDDDQSIYAWRGAMAGNILKFQECYPKARVVTLEQNYRSTSTILAAANAVIRRNSGRREKNLWSAVGEGRPIRLREAADPRDEAAHIAADIRRRLAEDGGRPSDFAVILRANAQSRPLEDEFLSARLPFEVIGGQSLFDRKEARDALAFLALAANPAAPGPLLRVINVPPRGIGEKTVDAVAGLAARLGRVPFVLLDNPALKEEAGAAQADACRRFAAQIRSWRDGLEKAGLEGLVRRILDDVDYRKELEQLYRDPLDMAARWNQALEVGESLSSFAAARPGEPPAAVLAAFLDEASLSGGAGRETDANRKGNAVRLITAHSAKGLEFPHVYIPGLEEDVFPHQNAMEEGGEEEERRLFYVAVTRAGRELSLSWNRVRRNRGKERKCLPSRFLAEIPVKLIQSESSPPADGDEDDFRETLAALRKRLK